MDQLDEEMIGSTVTLLGHIAAVTERYTRDNRKFLRVDMAMVGGQVETMVWPDSLDKTAHVWQPGRIARATGRLQIRGDDFSLACYEAQEYHLPDQPSDDAANGQPTPSTPASRSNGRNGASRPSNGSANGSKPAPTPAPPTANGNGHKSGDGGVLIKMAETDNADEDRFRLRQAIRVMLEYTGEDRVYLELYLKEGKRVLMEIPTVSTGSCDELQGRLRELLGEDCAEYRATIG